MNCSFAAVEHLLNKTQRQIFINLPTPLKESLQSKLQASAFESSPKVAMIALDLIEKTLSTPARDRLFIHLLKQPDNHAYVLFNKIHVIAFHGAFSVLLQQLDSKKKEPMPFSIIRTKIDKFYDERLPAFIPEQRTEYLKKIKDKIINCARYQEILQLCGDYANCLNTDKAQNSVAQIIRELVQHIDQNCSLAIEDKEKKELLRIVFLGLIATTRETGNKSFKVEKFLEQISYLRKQVGEEVLGYFFIAAKKETLCFEEIQNGLHFLCNLANSENFYELILTWKNNDFLWNQLFALSPQSVFPSISSETILEEDISTCLARFESDPSVSVPLAKEELQILGRQYERIKQFCKDNQHASFDQLMVKAYAIRERALCNTPTDEDKLLLVAIGRMAIRVHFGIFLNSTQVIALLGLLNNGRSRQAQIKTGEGKSFIIALKIFVSVMTCHTEDVITSARYLAIRDQLSFADFFKKCGILTSHICYDRKLPCHFQAHVLYGTVADFEFAWMEEKLYGSKLFEARLSISYVKKNFDCATVDEADNLLIDSASSSARMAIKSEESYDWVYAPILSYVKNKLSPFATKKEVKAHVNNINEILTNLCKDKCRKLCNTKLENWLKAAHQAFFKCRENVDYIVRHEKDKSSIQIIDISTGRIFEQCRWQNGMHEFLEVKHEIEIQKESLNPISLSHVVFYNFYQTVAALSGTAERFQTKQIYKIETFDVPPHLPCKRVDLDPIICEDQSSHYQAILRSVHEMSRKRRPILIPCRTIEDSLNLSDYLEKHNVQHQLLNEIQPESENDIVAKAGLAGQVTISTNNAGRGTNIILSKESIENGGLHVLVTFYPDSQREEEQILGRAGRQGQPGSSQIILYDPAPMLNFLKLIDSNNLTYMLSRQKIRNNLEIEMSLRDFSIAELERVRFQKLHQFYINLQSWSQKVADERVLEMLSQRLCNLRLRRAVPVPELGDQDQDIAQAFFQLLSNKTDKIYWTDFLLKTSKRLKQRILQAWATNYHQPSELCLHLPHSQAIIELEKLFNAQRGTWEKYLTPSLSALVVYIKDITNIDLSYLIK